MFRDHVLRYIFSSVILFHITIRIHGKNPTTPAPEAVSITSLINNSTDFTTNSALSTSSSTEQTNTPNISTPLLPQPSSVVNEENPSSGAESIPFQIPPFFNFAGSGNDGFEETFTYQVKKQRKSPKVKVPANLREEFGTLRDQNRMKSDYEAMQNYVNEINYEMNAKIRDLANSVQNLNYEMKSNSSSFNSTLYYLNQEVRNLTALSKETTHLIKVMQYSQEQERITLIDQISNLTDRFDRFQHEKMEEGSRVFAAISKIQMKIDNTTRDIQVHDIHLRHGQQVMSSMRSSIEKNLERIKGLETDAGPQFTEQTVGCGGVIIANTGIISYKYRQPYLNNERCVWIIRSNRRTKINLQILDDGFQNHSNSDYLTVTEFAEDNQPHPVTLITSTRLEHGNKAIHTFQGPVIFVTFYSDASSQGTGFILKFEGVGNRSDAFDLHATRYTHRHYGEPSGIFAHPADFSNLTSETTYQPNELVTIAINPPNVNFVKIQMRQSDLEKDEYCEFDSVSFYGSVAGSYALTKRYCQHGEKLQGEVIQSSEGLFLVIFRSDLTTQFSGFQFSWNSD